MDQIPEEICLMTEWWKDGIKKCGIRELGNPGILVKKKILLRDVVLRI